MKLYKLLAFTVITGFILGVLLFGGIFFIAKYAFAGNEVLITEEGVINWEKMRGKDTIYVDGIDWVYKDKRFDSFSDLVYYAYNEEKKFRMGLVTLDDGNKGNFK